MEDERRILLQIIESQAAQNAKLTEQVASLTAQVEELIRKLEEKNHRKTSKNSSAPLSSDGYAKPAPKSQRKSSGAKVGGQDGHKGNSMKLMKEPDEVREHYPVACAGCPNKGICHANVAERRYESEIVIESRLIEHRQIVCCCQMANNVAITGEFPQNITGTKQYGNNLKAFAVALSTVGMVGIERIHDLLTGVFQISVSTGSIQNWIHQLAEKVSPAVGRIREQINSLSVLNCDETGLRVAGSLHWLHCLCNERWSYFALHKKRGKKAMDDIGILPGFGKTMVHDFWKPYYQYDSATHGICNAHIIRELAYAEEEMKQGWAGKLRELLLEMNESRKLLQMDGSFQELVLQTYNLRYDNILADGFEANPVPAKPKWKRGRPGKGKILSLLERLQEYKADILRFATDWSVPFTNNEAERTIRFSKVKQKVSGCFRTIEGAEEYASIMSYISTARKQGMAYFESVKQALSGNALALLEQWV